MTSETAHHRYLVYAFFFINISINFYKLSHKQSSAAQTLFFTMIYFNLHTRNMFALRC